MMDVILKRFETSDETRVMVKGKFEIVRLGGLTIGRLLTSLVGGGRSMSVQALGRTAATSSTSGWSCLVRPRRRSTTAG